ncbi:MAG: hypothetical protein IH984_08475 [Planctomycetes bacterium]|nr:hypothetical protein [Planctomycetota bacterium]
MPREHSPIRSTSLTATATALLALAALATAASTGPLPGNGDLNGRTATSESQVVRAVAAAVAAVARDLLASDQHTALAIDEPFARSIVGNATMAMVVVSQDAHFAKLEVLDERLLDLPPPIC